jgi:hypothetical protein
MRPTQISAETPTKHAVADSKPALLRTRSGISGGNFVALLVCILFGLAMSLMPYFVWHGIWIADNDEMLYLSYAGQAYVNHPAYLSDPVFVSGGQTIYPRLLFVPGILTAKLFGLGPLGVSIVWRVWAGISIAVGWFFVSRFYTKKTWQACALTAVLLADSGLVEKQPIVRQFILSAKVLLGQAQDVFASWMPIMQREWRITSPGLTLGFLLLHIWLMARAREVPDRKRIFLAGVGLGILFYAYFYFWTAACVALLIALVLDRKYWKVYLSTACIGTLLGLPVLISSFLLKHSTSPDWLVRMDLGTAIPRFSELLFPKKSVLVLALLLVWVWRKRRSLIYVWALACAGLLLANSQILTGLQIQNIHWMFIVYSPCLSFLVVLAAGDGLARLMRINRLVPVAVCAVLVLYLAAGLWLRGVEAARTQGSTALVTTYREYRQQGLEAGQFLPNGVIAGDQDFVDFAVVLNNLRPLEHVAVIMSPGVDNAEWDYRSALNGFLRGLNRMDFERSQNSFFDHWPFGLEVRDPVLRAKRLQSRLQKYDEIAADPDAATKRFNVKYIALRNERATASVYLLSNWRKIQDGPYWQVWELK